MTVSSGTVVPMFTVSAPAQYPSRLRVAVRIIREQPLGVIGAIVLIFMAIVAVGAPWIAPFDPSQGNPEALSRAPATARP